MADDNALRRWAAERDTALNRQAVLIVSANAPSAPYSAHTRLERQLPPQVDAPVRRSLQSAETALSGLTHSHETDRIARGQISLPQASLRLVKAAVFARAAQLMLTAANWPGSALRQRAAHQFERILTSARSRAFYDPALV